MNDIPDWAGKRACELLNAETSPSYWKWPNDRGLPTVTAVAKLVMQHEAAPVDPDEEAVKRIICAWFAEPIFFPNAQEELARAVSQYKQEKGNG